MHTAMTLDDYIDAAIKAARLTSDRDLSRHLGFAGTPVNAWRCKRQWPSDEAMIALAKMASIDPHAALIDLNIWRSKTAKVRGEYQSMRDKVLAAIFIALVALSSLSAPAFATERDGNASALAFPLLYIMRYLDP